MKTESRALAAGQSVGRFGKRAPVRAVSALVAMALACAAVASGQTGGSEKPNGQRAGPAAAGRLVLKTARTSGNTDEDCYVWLDTPEQLIAPAGYMFRAEGSGFGVEDHWQDVRCKWSFGDPGYYKRWANNAAEHDDIPWDRVYDVDGTIHILRGPKIYNQAEELVEDKSATKTIKGYAPAFGTRKTFLGYDSNIAYGPLAVHVFNKPGAYTVTCEGRTRSGVVVTQTIKVTVKNPDVEFADADGNFTVWVTSQGAADPELPKGVAPTRVCKTLDGAMSAVDADAKGKKRRILLKRGECFSTSERSIAPNTGLAAFQLGAFGTGDPPRVTKSISMTGNTTQYSIWGLDRVEPYDPADPGPPRPVGFEKVNHGWITLSDVSSTGSFYGISMNDKGSSGLIASDVFITKMSGYGIWATTNVGMIGLAGIFNRQSMNAVLKCGRQENEDRSSGSNARINGPPVCVISFMDCMQIGPFSGDNNFHDHHNDIEYVKQNVVKRYSAIRLGRTQPSSGPLYGEAVVDRFRHEGCAITVDLAHGHMRPRRFIFDKIYGNVDQCHLVPSQTSGLVFRNMVEVYPDSYRSGRSNQAIVEVFGRRVFDFSGFDSPHMQDLGFDCHNCTFVDLRASKSTGFVGPWPGQGSIALMTDGFKGKGNGVADGGPYSGWDYRPYKYVKIGNNVLATVADNKGQSTDGLRDLDRTEIWRSGFPGFYWMDEDRNVTLMPEFAYPEGTCCYYKVKPGAPSHQAASPDHSNIGNVKGKGARIAVDDFFGNLRGEKTSRGAFD
jgi:hypothetical protein